MKNFNKIILSLGSNIGDKKSNLETAINEINEFSTIKKISSIYESDPILLIDQDNFFNLPNYQNFQIYNFQNLKYFLLTLFANQS